MANCKSCLYYKSEIYAVPAHCTFKNLTWEMYCGALCYIPREEENYDIEWIAEVKNDL